jgi:clorobiocin/coumermycin A biosynthesis protein CloN6/CouN6
MSRRDIQNVTYDSIGRLVEIKEELGLLPSSLSSAILKTIAHTRLLLSEIESSTEREGRLPQDLRDEIRDYNRKILAHSSDQATPLQRPFGGRWFDDATIPAELIENLLTARSEGAAL